MSRSTPTAQLGTPEFIALFSLMTALSALTIDAMLPALDDMGRALGISDARNTQLIVTAFILGMVFGELVFGPLSDAIGRKRAILIGLVIYCAGTLVALTASSIEQVLIGRTIQGIGVAGPKIGARALIRDLYKGDAMARIMSFVLMVFVLVPMIAPAIGQLVLSLADWRGLFVVFFVAACLIGSWMAVRQPETLAPDRRIPISLAPLIQNSLLIFRHARVMAYTVAAGFIFGAFLLYLSTAQAIFDDLYDAGDRFALYFAMLALGNGMAFFSNSQFVMRYGMHRLAVTALVGMIAASGLLMTVALRYDGVPPFEAFMALCFAMFYCFGILFGNLNAMAMESLGRVAGLGASIVASVSSLLAVAFAVSVGRFYDETALPLASGFMIAAWIALALLLVAKRRPAGSV